MSSIYLRFCSLFFLPISFRLIVRALAITTALQFIFRVAFGLVNTPTHDFGLWSQALSLGIRFDLRVAFFLWLPMLGLLLMPYVSSILRPHRLWWQLYSALVFTILLITLFVDWGHYGYLHTRLNANALLLLKNVEESIATLWATYPVIWLTVAAGLGVYLLVRYATPWILQANHNLASSSETVTTKHNWHYFSARLIVGLACTFFYFLALFGQVGQYPLRWSNLFFTPNQFYVELATNPLHNVFDTYRYAQSSNFDEAQFLATRDRTLQFLETKNPQFKRTLAANTKGISISDSAGPNVVIVLLESFSGYKTSTFGNPLNPTPFFAQLSQKGALFTRFYTAHAGTARGVFATLTGTPDVEIVDTASRNPLYARQNLLINQLPKDYEKFYFIGGSLNWANIRAVTGNIEQLKTYEETDFSRSRVDAWGLSDRDLFLEANDVLRTTKKPFFAVIQTAANHRPYTIPKDDLTFSLVEKSASELARAGFESNPELNAFRYLDHSLEKFFEVAQKEAYFANTIFVFLGDHGISGKTGPHMPAAFTDLNLSQIHTPLLFYAPQMIAPSVISAITQQVDILPTLFGRLNLAYTNYTLGRDGFSAKERLGFMIDHASGPLLTVFDDTYLLRFNLATKQANLYDYWRDTTTDIAHLKPAETQRLQDFAQAYFHSAQYLLRHNHSP